MTTSRYAILTKLHDPELSPPPVFKFLVFLVVIVLLCSITAAIQFAPPTRPMYHFGEKGLITAFSSSGLAAASAFAAAILYLRSKHQRWEVIFWLVLAAGCLFLSLDENLMFHERGGRAMRSSGLGKAEFFRNWNDLIVIAYGAIALVVFAIFRREILRCRSFAVWFGIGFAFYVVHTAVDSLILNSVSWKDIPEETAKLACVFALMLATCGQLMAEIDLLQKRKSAI